MIHAIKYFSKSLYFRQDDRTRCDEKMKLKTKMHCNKNDSVQVYKANK